MSECTLFDLLIFLVFLFIDECFSCVDENHLHAFTIINLVNSRYFVFTKF